MSSRSKINYKEYIDPIQYNRFLDNNIVAADPVFCDIETHGLYLEICLVQIYQTHWKMPILIKYPDVDFLKHFVKRSKTVWYNASYDLGSIGVCPTQYEDLFYAAKTAYPLLASHSLDSVEEHLGIEWHDWIQDVKEHLGVKYPKKDKKTGKMMPLSKKDMQKSFAAAKCKKAREFTPEQYDYAAADCYGLADMWLDRPIQRVIKRNDAYAQDIIAQKDALTYQYNGMPICSDRLELAKRKAIRLRNYNMRKLPAGLNVKSAPQVKQYFSDLGVKVKDTGEETLKKLMLEGTPEAEYILETRKYRTRLQDLDLKYTGYDRVKTFFNAAGAITGRFTSTGGERPGYTNIQNINRDLKYIFGYPEDSDRIMINTDYSTAELIAGCAIFKIPTMREWILDGLDIHKATASAVRGVPYDQVTIDQRQAAKAINFGLLFGMGAVRFMDYAYTTYGVKFTQKEAEEAKALYYKTHPAIETYHQQMGRDCKNMSHTVQTALGRVGGKVSIMHGRQTKSYTDMLNIPVQGSIAEATKVSIHHFIENNKKLLSANNMLVNMVHDSIVGDIHKKYIEDWSAAIKESMIYGWRYVSKSDLFHYQDLPMGVDVEVCHEYGGQYPKEKVQEVIKLWQ